MPLVQKYHYLSGRIPKKGQRVTLYYRHSPEFKFKRVVESGFFTFDNMDGGGACTFIDQLGHPYIVTNRTKHQYQWVSHKDPWYKNWTWHNKNGLLSLIGIVMFALIYILYSIFN